MWFTWNVRWTNFVRRLPRRLPSCERTIRDVSSDQLGDFRAQSVAALVAGDFVAATEATRQGVPMNNLMGLTIVRVDDGGALLTMEVNEEVRGAAAGTVHGGILATFADTAMAICLGGAYDMTASIPVTTDMHMRYYRQPNAGPLTANATVVHRGRRLLGAECCITDAHDRVLTRSTATYMLTPLQL